MPATKFSRRTLLTAGSALAVLPFLRALPVQAREPRETVDIKDYPADDGIASFKQAFADGQTVVVPPGWVCENINAAITIPAGKTLRVQGAVRGNGRGRFILQDGCQVVGEQGGSLHNVTLDVRGSDCVIKGVAMSGFGPVAQIFIGGKEPFLGKSCSYLMLWCRLRRNVERAIIIPGSRVIHAGENKLKSYNSATILQVEETMMNLKAVIPVAGLGMHMLPATKAIPKEMLPIVDKPMIQYIVDEIVAAGIKEIVLVTHASKNAVENHFDTSYELESLLEQRVKRQLLAEVQSICPPGVTIMNVRQAQPLGLGHSILCARPVVGDNPFIVVLPDIIIDDATADPLRYNLAAMVARFNETGRSQVLAKRMKGDLSEYSVIQTKEPLDNEGKVSRIVEFIEKPDQPQTLDSDLMAVGRYVLSADIWAELERTEPGAWGRIQLTDAIAELAKKQSVDAMLMTGDSYDCGKKMGYMQAFVKYGLRNLKEGAKFRKSIEQLLHE